MDNAIKKPKPAFGQMWLLLVAIFGSAIAFTAWKAYTSLISARQVTEEKIAVSNVLQIGIALSEFAEKYGLYPNRSVAPNSLVGTHAGIALSNTSSNIVFRQLLAAGLTQSEHMFYARIPGVRKPDGVITPGEALKKAKSASPTSPASPPKTTLSPPSSSPRSSPAPRNSTPNPSTAKPSSFTSTTPSAPTTSQKTAISTTPKASTSSPPSTPSGKAKPPTSGIPSYSSPAQGTRTLVRPLPPNLRTKVRVPIQSMTTDSRHFRNYNFIREYITTI